MNIKDINNTINSYVFNLLAYFDEVRIISETAETNFPPSFIYCLPSIAYGEVDTGELGMQGVSPRTSVLTVAFSIADNKQLTRMLELTTIVESAFRRAELKAETGDCIQFAEPYTTNAGQLEDKRFSYFVSCPFSTWTGGNA